MARLARPVAVGFPHHITHRGNRRCDIFLGDEDRRIYIGFLSECAAKAHLEIWGYCLMSNHVHLLAVPRREDALARGVGLAHRRYAVFLNRREGFSGHLWANRFFSTPLDEAHHWAAIRYIERNPVRAKIVATAEEWPWSSARSHVRGAPDPLLSPSAPYPGPVGDWGAWLAEPEEEERLEQLRRCTQTGRPCGGGSFVQMLEERLGRVLRPAKRGPKKKCLEEEDGQTRLFGP